MERVVVEIRTEGDYRGTETVADLRNAAETLYFPIRLVGFWDRRVDMHLCPQEERQQPCPTDCPRATQSTSTTCCSSSGSGAAAWRSFSPTPEWRYTWASRRHAGRKDPCRRCDKVAHVTRTGPSDPK